MDQRDSLLTREHMSMSNRTGKGKPLRAYTAREFLDAYEPGVVELMLDPENSLKEDTEKAHKAAEWLGITPQPSGHYPRSVWSIVYPA